MLLNPIVIESNVVEDRELLPGSSSLRVGKPRLASHRLEEALSLATGRPYWIFALMDDDQGGLLIEIELENVAEEE